MSLVVRGLSSPLLHDCHLTVSDGEVVALRGASGSGKSAFLRAVTDLDPNEGDVWLDDVSRSAMTGPEWRQRVRYVAAETAWWADRVGEHFRAPNQTVGMAVEIGLSEDCMTWEVARLSTGEKQRLGFLRAVEDSPRALLLDEPTAALDADTEAAVERLIQRHRSDGTAIILVTHSDGQASRLADRRMRIDNGRLSDAAP